MITDKSLWDPWLDKFSSNSMLNSRKLRLNRFRWIIRHKTWLGQPLPKKRRKMKCQINKHLTRTKTGHTVKYKPTYFKDSTISRSCSRNWILMQTQIICRTKSSISLYKWMRMAMWNVVFWGREIIKKMAQKLTKCRHNF